MQQPTISPRPLTRHDIKTLALAAVGGALEFYDLLSLPFSRWLSGSTFSLPTFLTGYASCKPSHCSLQVISPDH